MALINILSDPYWLNPYPGFSESGFISRFFNTKILKSCQLSEIAIYLFFAQSIKDSKLLKKPTALQKIKFLNFFLFCESFLPSWIRIWIHNRKLETQWSLITKHCLYIKLWRIILNINVLVFLHKVAIWYLHTCYLRVISGPPCRRVENTYGIISLVGIVAL